MVDRATASLAGVRLELETGGLASLTEDSLWRLREVYERFLATQTLPPIGRAIDIGAGFGAFALPFAHQYPGWEVWCFEPNSAAFAALERNILSHGLTNVRAYPVAVMGVSEAVATRDVTRDWPSGGADALLGACTERNFRCHLKLDGFIDANTLPDPETEVIGLPTLPAAFLAPLEPDLVKLIAPQAERGILEALRGKMPQWLLGESWQMLSPRLLENATRAAWVPFARSPRLGLRRSALGTSRRDGLDIVLHAGNASAGHISEAVNQLTATEAADVCLVLVAEPQSVLPTLPDHPRLKVLRTPHSGWTTAHNLGRSQSMARHLAFIDVLDRPEPGLFTRLLDLARLSGSEVVQGGNTQGPSWAALPKDGLFQHEGQGGGFLPAKMLIAVHPPTRARVLRHDFLDARKIWLPEHLGAYSGHYLHFMTLQHAGMVPMLPSTGFRETHGMARSNESAFYLLEVCRLILKRGIEEGWPDFAPLLDGFCLALRGACTHVLPPLQSGFVEGMAELLVLMEKALGSFMPRPADQAMPEIPRLSEAVERLRHRLRGAGDSYAWAWMDGPRLQSPFIQQYKVWQDRPG